jgi:putative transcriptional regulator
MSPAPADEDQHVIVCHLDVLLEQRHMTLKELSERVGVTVVNLSVLKNDRARAVRFSTLAALCGALDCQPGDLFSYAPAAPTPERDHTPTE